MSEPTIPDWINAIAAAIGALAIIIGLLGANSKLNASRRTAKEMRRSQVAEELISLAFNVDDALREIRNPFDSVPAEKISDKVYKYERRYERIVLHNDLFKRLRDAQIRVRAVVGDDEVDKAVETLFKARNKVAIAIEILAEYAREGNAQTEDREHKKKLRADLYGRFTDKDSLGNQIESAVKTIELRLSPIARLEAEKI